MFQSKHDSTLRAPDSREPCVTGVPLRCVVAAAGPPPSAFILPLITASGEKNKNNVSFHFGANLINIYRRQGKEGL